MPVSLTIVCSLEQISALDVYDEQASSIQLAFGLNFSVGASGADKVATLAPFLSPWTWKISGVRLQWKNNTPVDGVIIPQNPPKLTVLEQRLADDLKNYDNPDKVGQLAVPDSRTTASAGAPKLDGTTSGAIIPPWTPRLMHLSTFPFPLPQSLKLSLLFRVDIKKLKAEAQPQDYFKIPKPVSRRERVATDFAGDFAAVPVLGVAGPFDSMRSPDDLGPQEGLWSYKSGTGADVSAIAAQVRPIGINPPADAFLNLADQWVRHPPGARVDFAEDWQSRLEVRMAEAFRLPEFIADYAC